MRFKLPPKERLKSSKAIEHLFQEGFSSTKRPLKLIYLPQEDLECNKVSFAVPKRTFRLASSRNLIKRYMREAYRLHKNELDPNMNTKYALLFLYINKEAPEHQQIANAMNHLLKTLQK